MRRIILPILILFLSVLSSGLRASAQGTGLSVIPTATKPAEAKLVTALEIKGNKSISTNTILSKMKTKIGNPYQENVVSDDLKRLYLLGFFSDIKIDTEPYKDGIKVIVSVTERPIVEKITFSGITRLIQKDEKLKEQLKSKEGQYLDYPSLAEDARTIKKMYEKIGYNDALIDHKVEVNKDTNKATVQFVVVENKKEKIRDIVFQGNTAFSGTKLLRLIKTRKAWLFNAGVLKEDTLKDDVDRLKEFYHRAGYSDVQVEHEIKVETDAKKLSFLVVVFKINEGKKYFVGNVTIQGCKEIREKEALASLKACMPGKVFSQEGLKDDVSAIQGLYFDRGYIACVVDNTTSVNPTSGRVDINYSVTENQICFIGKVKVRGNVKTRDMVVRRELTIHPGDRFDGEKLRRSRERLMNLGFFDEQQGISYDTEDTQAPEVKDLVVEVKEAKTGAFSLGGGYSTVDSFVGFVEVEQKNFDWKNFPYFTGAGQDLRVRASFGTLTSSNEISFTEPWLFDYPISFGFDAYSNEHKREEDVGYGYNEKVIGGDLRLGKALSDYWRVDSMYKFERIEITDVDESASPELKQEEGTNDIISYSIGPTFDSRDNAFSPRKGNLLTGSAQIAGGILGGDKDFWKIRGRFSHYFPMPRNSALELRLRGGLAEPYNDSVRVPIYERFFAGGTDTIRGYEERMVGPIDPVTKDPLGGEAMVVANLEYLYPILDFIKVAAFYDTGNVWAKFDDLSASGFKSGIGLGLRLKTPIGPISLDYGIPLNVEPGENEKKSGRFHFSASHGF